MNTVTSPAPTRQPFGRTPGLPAVPAAFRQRGRELRQVGTFAAIGVVSTLAYVALYALLRPFVAALPRFTQVNVNTAPPEVLAAIVEGLDLDSARALVVQRDRTFFRSPADFSNRVPRGLMVPFQDITVSSDYFMATLRVTIGEAEARGMALLAREDARWPAIVWRKFP